MKILFFTRRFWPSIGGVEKHCLEGGKILVKKGHQVAVVTEEVGDFGGAKEEIDGIKIYRIPVTAGERLKKFQIWKWLWLNRKLIREADIVHCHDVFFWYLPFRFLYPRKKVFTTFHGWEGIYPPRWQSKLIRKISEKLSFGNICVGDFINKWYGTKPDLVTYGGVSSQQSVVSRQERIKKPKILFIGRLEEDTGLKVYLKAIEQFSIFNLKFEIKFAGDGSLREEAEKYGEVLGFIEDVGNYIKEADFVFSSGYLSILEAMAQKKLVFSVFDNLLKEDYLKLAPFSQWIVIESGPKELSEKIKFYHENANEGEKWTGNAYNWARQQTWEKLTEEYLTLWER